MPSCAAGGTDCCCEQWSTLRMCGSDARSIVWWRRILLAAFCSRWSGRLYFRARRAVERLRWRLPAGGSCCLRAQLGHLGKLLIGRTEGLADRPLLQLVRRLGIVAESLADLILVDSTGVAVDLRGLRFLLPTLRTHRGRLLTQRDELHLPRLDAAELGVLAGKLLDDDRDDAIQGL